MEVTLDERAWETGRPVRGLRGAASRAEARTMRLERSRGVKAKRGCDVCCPEDKAGTDVGVSTQRTLAVWTQSGELILLQGDDF